MGIKDQIFKLKENWLLVLIVVVILGAFMFSGGSGFSGVSMQKSFGVQEVAMDMAYAPGASYERGVYYDEDFAPEVDDRLIAKTASLSTEVEHGEFKEEETKLKNIIKASDAYLLNENVNKYDSGWKEYFRGSYQIKVETSKYDSVLDQLKDLGEVQSFNENAGDITGRHTNLQMQLDLEKERLKRYKEMYAVAEEVEDKINLNDRIFNQERTIKYLEDALTNVERKVDYSTLYFTISEKRSGYSNIVLVKLSDLVKSFVSSFNSLLKLISVLIPYAIAVLLIALAWRFFKKRAQQ